MFETELVKKFKKSYEIKMSPNGKYIGHFNSSAVSLFDAENDLQIAVFRDIKYPSHITFSRDSKLLAVKSNQRKIAVYDLEKLELFKMFNIKKNSQPQDYGFCSLLNYYKILTNTIIKGCVIFELYNFL